MNSKEFTFKATGKISTEDQTAIVVGDKNINIGATIARELDSFELSKQKVNITVIVKVETLD